VLRCVECPAARRNLRDLNPGGRWSCGKPLRVRAGCPKEKYASQAASPALARIYDDPEFGHTFAVLRQRLNRHFDEINGRATTTSHYWADNSREMLGLTKEIN